MTIKEIALKIARSMADFPIEHEPYEYQIKFAEAIVAELAKENEPVVWYDGNKFYANEESASMGCADMANLNPLYLLPPTAEQVEQETAEAIAKMLDDKDVGRTGYCMHEYEEGEQYKSEAIAAVRNGAWKEYK